MFESLQNEVQDQFNELRPTIEKLRSLGVQKELYMRAASNIVVTYPSKQDLAPEQRGAVTTAGLNIVGPSTLYFHMPFCSAICSYCDFARSAADSNDSKIEDYFHLVEAEATMWKRRAGGPVPVNSIYIGGGTPTLLDVNQLQRLFNIIGDNFVLMDAGEYTLEASPHTVTAEKISLAHANGINRVSMGVESFNEAILVQMRRPAGVPQIFDAINIIRDAGIAHVDIDLIRGYPTQTLNDLQNDLIGIQKANTPSVTSYQYILKPQAIDKKRLGDFALQQDNLIMNHLMFMAGAEKLGYQHQAPLVDWFIKGPEWAYQQQVQKWLKMHNLISVGLGTYGYINGIQYINYEDRRRYANSITEGHMPVEKAAVLSSEELMRRRMIFGLKGNIDRAEFREAYGVDVTQAPFHQELGAFVDAGGIELSDSSLKLSKTGILFADWIQMAFYSSAYKEMERNRIAARVLPKIRGLQPTPAGSF